MSPPQCLFYCYLYGNFQLYPSPHPTGSEAPVGVSPSTLFRSIDFHYLFLLSYVNCSRLDVNNLDYAAVVFTCPAALP